MYNVAQVLNPEFERNWPESVALVQEAASMLHSGLVLPDPEDLLLNEAGTLSLGFGSESSQHPVVALASLLDRLLGGTEAPESLRALVNENLGDNPKCTTVEAFSKSLSFFERPNRTNDLRGLAERLKGRSGDRAVIDLEFERLREKVGGKPAEEKKAAEGDQPHALRIPKLTPLQQQIAAAGIIVAVLLAIVAIKGSPAQRIQTGYERVVSGMSSGISGVLDSFGMSAPASAAPATASATAPTNAPSTAPPAATATGGNAEALENPSVKTPPKSGGVPAATTTHARNTAAASTAVERGSEKSRTKVPQSADGSAPAPGLASRSLSPPTLRAEPATVSPVVPPMAPAVPALPTATAPAPTNGVYSPETPGVNPPVLMRPQMPREPAPGEDTGYFDMIVDEKGSVEQVKLISPRRRYHDRMLVAAAKAWQFRPASLNGQPVKYRLLVPIILSGLPY